MVSDSVNRTTAKYWLPRFPSGGFLISCRRDLLDWAVRQGALADPRTTLRTGTQAVGLTGTRSRVAGARVPNQHTGATSELTADRVIDATGCGSRAVHRLTGLGLPRIWETGKQWKVTSAPKRAPSHGRWRVCVSCPGKAARRRSSKQ